MLKLAFVSLTLFIASANAFWSACEGGVPNASAVTGSTCSNLLNRCVATRGNTLTLDITFTPQAAHSRLDSGGVITHNLLPTPVPVTFEAPNDNACNNLLIPGTREFVGCPTVPGEARLWHVIMNIPDLPAQLPAVTGATLRMTMSSGGSVIGCTNVRIDVV